MYESIFICLLLCHNIGAQKFHGETPDEINEARYCEFDEARNNYNAIDLLQCIDELAIDLIGRETAGATNGKGQENGSTGRQISFMDVFTSVFNNAATSHQSHPVTSGYEQSNHPAGVVAPLSPGFQLNLLDALYTISRHDDYKCVARILCEMASGKLPGRSFAKKGSGFFEFLGRNVFTDWLTKFDVDGTSPLLNYGRAMILGYSNRGNSGACYQAFPKCPKDMKGLVHYLNTYNGGFFRLFNRFHSGKYRQSDRVPNRVGDNSKIEVRERIVAGNSDYIRGRPIYKIQFPIRNYQEYLDKEEFPAYDKTRNDNEISFPDQSNESTTNSLQNDLPQSESTWQPDRNIYFFPQGKDERRYSRFRFPSGIPDTFL
ncbi:uncharacterized protein LOC108627428 [Ceratina calcarata]|uniref:Uncharacterized protein LOC108627428 n=1 Tax=Ceratina calcarata TaxID=156304 RepID=A0AAJ7WCM7_9HYME|nr:uncharacterized protein LOC108627428 [Ceratina calcarata]